MQLRDHGDPRAFLAAARPLLERDEARHNLAFGICATLVAAPETHPEFHLWTVADDSVVAAALLTPPFNLWVAQPVRADALEFLARELAATEAEPPGVTAALPEADRFAEAWEQLRPRRRRLVRAQGIYKVESPRLPAGVPGRMRAATATDRELLVDWFDAFGREALGPDSARHAAAETVARRLAGRGAGIAIWEDGRPASCAGFGGETPNGIRIGPVYTPSELRGRGYASALTAELSRQLLAEGRRYCFLYTDLANPTANRIYVNIGYVRVCDSAEYVFEPA